MVALSVSSSITGWSLAIVSPGLTRIRRTSPLAMFSPSSGSVKSVTNTFHHNGHEGDNASCPSWLCVSPASSNRSSRNSWIALLGIDAEIADGRFDHRPIDLPVAGQRAKRRDDDIAIIDLKEVAQGRARLAAPEAVGAERRERPREPAI